MRKATKDITVEVVRGFNSSEEYAVREDITVGEFLSEVGIELNGSESIWVDGVKAEMDDVLTDGDLLNITGKNGNSNR